MSTAWVYYILAITTDKTTANVVATKLNPDPGAVDEFPTELRKVVNGSTAWLTGSPMTAVGYAAVQEFAAGGYPAALAAQGVTEAQVDAARAVMTLQTGLRSEMAAQASVFLAANGYEIIPEAGA